MSAGLLALGVLSLGACDSEEPAGGGEAAALLSREEIEGLKVSEIKKRLKQWSCGQ